MGPNNYQIMCRWIETLQKRGKKKLNSKQKCKVKTWYQWVWTVSEKKNNPYYYSLRSKWVQIILWLCEHCADEWKCIKIEKKNGLEKLVKKTNKQTNKHTKQTLPNFMWFHLHIAYTSLGKRGVLKMWPPLSCKWGNFWHWNGHILNTSQNSILF